MEAAIIYTGLIQTAALMAMLANFRGRKLKLQRIQTALRVHVRQANGDDYKLLWPDGRES